MRRNKMLRQLEAPEGFVYEWKVMTVLGVPVDRQDLIDYELAGWTYVPAERHPREKVEAFGCRLMEIPADKCAELKAELLGLAKEREQWIVRNEIAKDHCPSGFRVVVAPDDMDLVLTECGWLPSSLVRAMEEAEENNA